MSARSTQPRRVPGSPSGREDAALPSRARLTPAPGAAENGEPRSFHGKDHLIAGRRFYVDLHSHSTDASDDAGGTVEGYLKWIAARRRRGYHIDGFVLTEHRQYDPTVEYSALAEQYEAVVLRGAELETTVGHVLVYGITDDFLRHFDLSSTTLRPADVFRIARETGGFAVAAHAGRPSIGIAEHVANGHDLEHVEAVEALNGGSSDHENGVGAEFAEQYGLHRVGGSDAHYVSAIGRCLTAFARPVTGLESLVEQLAAGDYYPVTIEQTLEEEAV